MNQAERNRREESYKQQVWIYGRLTLNYALKLRIIASASSFYHNADGYRRLARIHRR
jgi:hypothetical protein